MKKFIMSIDAGTTSARAIIFNEKAEIVSMAQKELKQFYPKPGWVEQGPEEILQTQIEVCNDAIKRAGISPSDILGIGITNQRETTVLWDKLTGKPVFNAIVWQCRRTSDYAQDLINRGYGDFIRERTGLVPDAYFSGTKIKWILDNVSQAQDLISEDRLLFGTVDSWLIYNLTGNHVTDYSNASRTMLYNIKELSWDEELLSLLNIPKGILPKVLNSGEFFGNTKKEFFNEEIPILSVLGDQQAALFGQLCFNEGDAKNTYGTGAFILMNTGDKPVISNNGLLATIFYGFKDKVFYASEGAVFVAGSAVKWLRDELNIIDTSAETEDRALSVEDTAGCYVVPAFNGLGAPYWDQDARGIILGLTQAVNKNHLVRATLESIAFLSNDVLKVMEEESQLKLKSLKVDGGASNNNFLMQFQSDITNVSIVRPKSVEATALGVCFLAGLQGGMWQSLEEVANLVEEDKTFNSSINEVSRIEKLRGWEKAVSLAMGYKEE